MKTLISPQAVVSLAFTADDCLPADAVLETDIAAAEQRYLRPLLGDTFYEKLLERPSNDERAFIEEHIAPVLAYATRLLIQSRLDVRTGRLGTASPRTDTLQPADVSARDALRESLRTTTRTLLKRLTGYLNAHTFRYPNYDPANNVYNRCSIDGKYVQIF